MVDWAKTFAGINQGRQGSVVRRRRYEGASTGRQRDWGGINGGSADSEIAASLMPMRDRARDLGRNNALAKRILEVLPTLLVGDGIVTTSNTGNEALDKKVNELWARHCDVIDAEREFDIYGLQQLAVRGMIESGESLGRFRTRLLTDNLPVPFQVQIMEPDLIDSSKDGLINGQVTRLGIQFDPLSRKSGYWLLKNHPGDRNPYLTNSFDSSLIDSADIIHMFVKSRPGQSRGVTWLDAVMNDIRDMGDISSAVMFREKLNSCMTGFIERTADWTGDDDTTEEEEDSEGNTRTIETIEPGVNTNLRQGEVWKPAELPGVESGYDAFMKLAHRRIASGSMLTYDQLTSDMTEANFSSLKASDRIQRRWVSKMQWQLIIPRLVAPMYQRFIEMGTAFGMLPLGATYKAKHIPPGHEYIDKSSEIEADIQDMAVGGMTWSQFCMMRGWDPRTQADEILKDRKLLESAGIDIGSLVAALAGKPKPVAPAATASPPSPVKLVKP